VSSGRRNLTKVLVTIAVLAVVAGAGYFVVRARSGGDGAPQPTATPSPTPTTLVNPIPPGERLVAKALGKVTVYRQPSTSAGVRVTLPKLNAKGQPTLMLVRKIREIEGDAWYSVWLATRPNGSKGWVPASAVGTYTSAARIVIDVSARELSVYVHDGLKGRYPIAVGSSKYPTPTGLFFIDEKVWPKPPDGLYGVLAMGLSGIQPRLPKRGSLAIHGTNNNAGIGKAITEGCIRMHNPDVLKVSAQVLSGSPVVIKH
jgi:lipoprotein-anchoring transpeptidase ErfK/SrfK